MKRQVLLTVLAAIALFAVTTNVEAGMFGRLSHVLKGCGPCCEVGCEPCEPACCEPCEPACNACEPCCDPCGRKPFRPFGGFFANMHARWAAKGCNPCGEVGCEPCEPACCEPCEPACDACEPVCDPCGRKPFRPFGGFFANMHARWAAKGCNPCGEVACEPVCEPCAPCDPCR